MKTKLLLVYRSENGNRKVHSIMIKCVRKDDYMVPTRLSKIKIKLATIYLQVKYFGYGGEIYAKHINGLHLC